MMKRVQVDDLVSGKMYLYNGLYDGAVNSTTVTFIEKDSRFCKFRNKNENKVRMVLNETIPLVIYELQNISLDDIIETTTKTVEYVTCSICGKEHVADGNTFITVFGNIYIGIYGGIVGNNLAGENTVVHATIFCNNCFLDYISSYLSRV